MEPSVVLSFVWTMAHLHFGIMANTFFEAQHCWQGCYFGWLQITTCLLPKLASWHWIRINAFTHPVHKVSNCCGELEMPSSRVPPFQLGQSMYDQVNESWIMWMNETDDGRYWYDNNNNTKEWNKKLLIFLLL